MKHIFFTFIASLFMLESLYAQTVGGVIAKPVGAVSVDTSRPLDILSKMITYAIGLAAILGVIGITWGGIEMILSVGEDEKLKKARKTVVYSIIGVVVAGLAYSIVMLIGNFRIPIA